MKSSEIEIKANAIIVATGWKPYDATKIDNLHFDQFENVITNTMMERLASPNGPTQGKILRPSDGKKVDSVAFVQCAGSRDENHMPFCSAVCCTASFKQTNYVRDFNPESKIYLFYIDLRAAGRNEDVLQRIQKDQNLTFIKGKVADIQEDPESGGLTVVAEDIYSGNKYRQTVDMVVLATGMQPTMSDEKIPFNGSVDKYGFFIENFEPDNGIFYVGTCKTPTDVSSCIKDANSAALKAMQCI
jgi:quinone-modifying oxidoreductase, subunit QmoA